MTSSSRISLILLVFFLLPTIVSSIKCYRQDHIWTQLWEVDCYPPRGKCTKVVLMRNMSSWASGCAGNQFKDGWQDRRASSQPMMVQICSTELCNSADSLPPGVPPPPPTIAPPRPSQAPVPPPITPPPYTNPPPPPFDPSRYPLCIIKRNNVGPQTAVTSSGTKGNGTDPSNPLGGFNPLVAAGHQSTWMCLMGMMMSWLLLIN